MSFRTSLVAFAALATQYVSAQQCVVEMPIDRVVVSRQEAIGDNTIICSFQTTTSDGYELALYRIAAQECGNSFVPKTLDKGPMILVHGASSDSSTWWFRSDPSAELIANQFAADGYDVWFANIRGSLPSRTHELASFDADG